jgi:hypothetical protein
MRLHFDLVNDLYVRTKYNTTLANSNPSVITPLVCMQSLILFCLLLIYRAYFPFFSLSKVLAALKTQRGFISLIL